MKELTVPFLSRVMHFLKNSPSVSIQNSINELDKERSVYLSTTHSVCVCLFLKEKKNPSFCMNLIKAVKELQGHNKLHCALPKEFCQAAILNSNE